MAFYSTGKTKFSQPEQIIDNNPVKILGLDSDDVVVLSEPIISQTITDGITNKTPSEDAVFDALGTKIDKNNVIDFNKSYIAPATTGNKRNSEGDVLKLNDGRYLTAYSSFNISETDFSPSMIMGKISVDSTGDEWGNEILVSPNIGLVNVLSVSLLRADASTIHCYFLVRNSFTDLGLWRVVSTNEGLTWGTATSVINDGYTDILNASVKRGNSNRILISGNYIADGSAPSPVWNVVCYRSDNNGTSFSKSNVIAMPESDGETCIVWMGGNNVLMSTRTLTGFQWFSLSTDNGTTFGTPYQSTLPSSNAPAQIINFSGTLLALHNPSPFSGNRDVLAISKSLDSGATWTQLAGISSPGFRYSYPSITIDGNFMLISYYELLDGGFSQKFSKINVPDLLAGIIPESASPNNLFLKGITFGKPEVIQPEDNVVEALGKVQAQINKTKGDRYFYQGDGAGLTLKNMSPTNVMSNLFVDFRNTDGTLVTRIGHTGGAQSCDIISTKKIDVNTPQLDVRNKAIFLDRLSIGINENPANAFTVAKTNAGAFEIDVSDTSVRAVELQAYDRIAGVYRPMRYSGSSHTFGTEVTIPDGIAQTSAVNVRQLQSSVARQINVTSAATYNIVPTSSTIMVTFNGTTTTATLPTIIGNEGAIIFLTNAGTGMVTINSNAGANDIWEGGALSNTSSVPASTVMRLINDGIKWRIL